MILVSTSYPRLRYGVECGNFWEFTEGKMKSVAEEDKVPDLHQSTRGLGILAWEISLPL